MLNRVWRPVLCLLVAVYLLIVLSTLGGRPPAGVRVDDGTPAEVTLIGGTP